MRCRTEREIADQIGLSQPQVHDLIGKLIREKTDQIGVMERPSWLSVSDSISVSWNTVTVALEVISTVDIVQQKVSERKITMPVAARINIWKDISRNRS